MLYFESVVKTVGFFPPVEHCLCILKPFSALPLTQQICLEGLKIGTGRSTWGS